jgi:hypothetical protein
MPPSPAARALEVDIARVWVAERDGLGKAKRRRDEDKARKAKEMGTKCILAA